MKKQWIKWAAVIALVLAIQWMGASECLAQCPMCRMSAESNLSNGGSVGKGLNTGIIYMLATPYLLVSVLGFIWWRNRRAERELDAQQAEQD